MSEYRYKPAAVTHELNGAMHVRKVNEYGEIISEVHVDGYQEQGGIPERDGAEGITSLQVGANVALIRGYTVACGLPGEGDNVISLREYAKRQEEGFGDIEDSSGPENDDDPSRQAQTAWLGKIAA